MPKHGEMIIKPNGSNELIHSLDDILTLAKIAAASKLFPQCTTEQHAAVKILAGRELGVPPMAALRGIHVIQGKAEIGAGLLAAMVKQSGKYDYKVVKADDSIAEIAWFEHGELVGRSAFTMEDANRAGLVQPGSGWKKYPRAMLFARALTEGQRRYAPDVAIGATYAPGEISEDYIDVEPEPVEYKDTGVFATVAPSPETPQADPIPAATLSDERQRIVDLSQSIAKNYGKTHGVTREKVFAKWCDYLGRTVNRASEIHDHECGGLLDSLEQWEADLRSDAQDFHAGK